MRRDRVLVPLSHDHHHALVEARRLRGAADGPEPGEAASAFLRFFASETVRHFRQEEELLFPRVVGLAEAREPLVRALLEHQRLHALAAALEASLTGEQPLAAPMHELAEALEEHVRYEERELFPLVERLLGSSGLAALPLVGAARSPGGGPVWGAESDDLNATLLAWGPGGGPPEHVNEERDVLVAVVEGSAEVAVDGEPRRLAPGEAVIVGKGRMRRIEAGPDGVRYLLVHRRRSRLQIASPGSPAPAAE